MQAGLKNTDQGHTSRFQVVSTFLLLTSCMWSCGERGLGCLLRPLTLNQTGYISTSSLNHRSLPLRSTVGPRLSAMLSLGRGMISPLLSCSPEGFQLIQDLFFFYSSLLTTMCSSISLGGRFFFMSLKITKARRPTEMMMSKIQNYCLSFQKLGTQAYWLDQAWQVLASLQSMQPGTQLRQDFVLSVRLVQPQQYAGQLVRHSLSDPKAQKLMLQEGRHTLPQRKQPLAQVRHWVLDGPQQVRQQLLHILATTQSYLMPQNWMLGSASVVRALKLRKRQEVLCVIVYSRILMQSDVGPTYPQMFSTLSTQQQRQSQNWDCAESCRVSRRESLSVQVPMQPTLKRTIMEQWLRGMLVKFLEMQSWLVYWPEKVQLVQVMVVVLELLQPVRAILVLGRSLAMMEVWASRPQGVVELMLAFWLQMWLAQTQQPWGVSSKQVSTQSMHVEEQQIWKEGVMRQRVSRRIFMLMFMMLIGKWEQLQSYFYDSAFQLRILICPTKTDGRQDLRRRGSKIQQKCKEGQQSARHRIFCNFVSSFLTFNDFSDPYKGCV